MKRQSLPLFIMVLLGILLLLFWLPANRALLTPGEIRAAIDIGSGATNLRVAKVDPNTQKILVLLFEKSITVPYQKHLEQSSDETFDTEVMDQGIQTIKILKQLADSHQAQKVIAVATAAFRKAKNSESYAKEIEKETGVPVRIINQDEEGILAFRGALATTSVDPNHAITWDIGGGSMQLTTLTKEGTYFVEKGKTASIPFKNYVIQDIEHKDLQTTTSPNPMTLEEMQAAAQYAAQLAETADPFIKSKIADPNTRILAVGGLFNYGVKPIVDHSIMKPEELEKGVMKFAGKGDSELPGGSLAEVSVTNPLIVLGFMKGLDMKQVEIIDVNNSDGALTYPPYWQ